MEDDKSEELKNLQQRIADENTSWYVLAREKGTSEAYKFAGETPLGCRVGLSLRPTVAFQKQRASEIKEILEKNGYDVNLAKICGEYDIISIDRLALNELAKRINNAMPSPEF